MKQQKAPIVRKNNKRIFKVVPSLGLHIDGQYVRNPMPAVHAHDDIELFMLTRGGATFLLNGQHIRLPVQQVCLYWSGIPHQTCQLDPDTFSWCVNLPLSWFLHWNLPQEMVNQVLGGQMICDPNTDPLIIEQTMFERWRYLNKFKQPNMRQILLLELEARIRRVGLSAQKASHPIDSEHDLTQSIAFDRFEKMMRMLVEQACDPNLSISGIADDVGLNPKYICRLFKRFAGRRPMEFLTQQRLARSQHLLAMTDRTILDIAMDSGFGSQARFYAAFKEYCKQTPREYRLRMQNANLTMDEDHE